MVQMGISKIRFEPPLFSAKCPNEAHSLSYSPSTRDGRSVAKVYCIKCDYMAEYRCSVSSPVWQLIDERGVTDQANGSDSGLRQLSLPGVTTPGMFVPAELQLVLSLFPGIDLLGRGFEDEGFCVVRGPDLIWGGDVRRFNPPAGKFSGVIGGSPCQDFSSARRAPESGNGREMIGEFVRVVEAACPDWWLLENVPGVPDVKIDGYNWQRLDVRASEFGLRQRRLRHIQFGSRSGMVLVLKRNAPERVIARAVMASDSETLWAKFCELQGLPVGFDIPSFTVAAKRRAVGNGVPLPVARALARAVVGMVPAGSVRLCACRCGRVVSGNQMYAGAACRMRAMRRRRGGGTQKDL